MKGTKKILFISVIPSDFTKLLALGQLLVKHSFEVEFYFDQRSHSLEDSIRVAKENLFYCHNINRGIKKSEGKSNHQIISFFLTIKLFVFLKRFRSAVRNINILRTSFVDVLKKRNISLVVVPLNSSGYNLPIYLDACKKNHIKTVCLPFSIGDKEAFEKSIIFSPKSSSDYLFNQKFSVFFKKWKLYSNQKPYFIFPVEEILAYILMGVEVQYPTSFYGVHINILMLENEYMKSHALKQGVAADSIIVSGSIFDDELFNLKSNYKIFYKNLCHRYSFDKTKELILIALPPLVRKEVSDTRFFDSIVLLKKFIPDTLDLKRYNVLVSLHPRIQHYYSDCKDTQVQLSQEPVERLIPLCKLFISTFSSTIRTAISLNIPVINYDILHFNYQLYDDFSTVKKVQNEEQYINAITDWMNQTTLMCLDEEYNLLSSSLDGQTNSRILNEFKKATKSV